jgi:hypothetical protein
LRKVNRGIIGFAFAAAIAATYVVASPTQSASADENCIGDYNSCVANAGSNRTQWQICALQQTQCNIRNMQAHRNSTPSYTPPPRYNPPPTYTQQPSYDSQPSDNSNGGDDRACVDARNAIQVRSSARNPNTQCRNVQTITFTNTSNQTILCEIHYTAISPTGTWSGHAGNNFEISMEPGPGESETRDTACGFQGEARYQCYYWQGGAPPSPRCFGNF